MRSLTFWLLLALSVASCGCTRDDSPSANAGGSASPASDHNTSQIDPVFHSDSATLHQYKIISQEPAQDGTRSMMRARIEVPADLSRADLEANIRSAAKEIADQRKIDSMLLFADKPGTDPGGEYSAGRLVLTPSDVGGAPTVQVDLSDFYFASKSGEVPVGKEEEPVLEAVKKKYNEDQRRSIYFQTGQAEDQGVTEAKRRVPDPSSDESDAAKKIMRQTGIANDLQEKYRHRLARKKGLTDKQLEVIGLEGTLNHWTSPE